MKIAFSEVLSGRVEIVKRLLPLWVIFAIYVLVLSENAFSQQKLMTIYADVRTEVIDLRPMKLNDSYVFPDVAKRL